MALLPAVVLFCALFQSSALNTPTDLTFNFEDGSHLPLVGFGVGNLGYDKIDEAIDEACSKQGVTFIDTAAASNNEKMIVSALRAVKSLSLVQVQSKVWYTHLGKERTKLSIRNSIDNLSGVGGIVMLIHWPRCRRDIPWMHCEEEENALPESVKAVGTPPHLDTNAWRGSWEALEESYLAGELSAIGVSNFDTKELTELLSSATVKPHILQGNVWSVVYDPHLIQLCQKNGIMFQAYNVMNGLMSEAAIKKTPKAFHSLVLLGLHLSKIEGEDQCSIWANQGECEYNSRHLELNNCKVCSQVISPSKLILRWLTQQNIAVIPRASSPRNIASNSPTSISTVPKLTEDQMSLVGQAARSLLSGNDLAEEVGVTAAFHNSDVPHKVSIFWVHADTREEVLAAELAGGGRAEVKTYKGHTFVARGEGIERWFSVASAIGTENFHIASSEL